MMMMMKKIPRRRKLQKKYKLTKLQKKYKREKYKKTIVMCDVCNNNSQGRLSVCNVS
jgi:hypothetical protein